MISKFFIDRPVFASVLAIVITLAGLVAMRALPIAQYPQIVPPEVVVSATYPGATAETIATTVAAPLEQQINGISNMLYMSSQSTGEGRMTITESIPADHVTMKLEFLKPFESTSDTKLKLTPEADGTKVTWSMDGANNFMSKVMSVFMDMDKMVGGDFEEGLANLKAAAEKN